MVAETAGVSLCHRKSTNVLMEVDPWQEILKLMKNSSFFLSN
jgi:hypothetical protein